MNSIDLHVNYGSCMVFEDGSIFGIQLEIFLLGLMILLIVFKILHGGPQNDKTTRPPLPPLPQLPITTRDKAIPSIRREMDEIDHNDLETLIAWYCERRGYDTYLRGKASVMDGGIDIEAVSANGRQRIGVQVKHLRNGKIGSDVIQRTYGAANQYEFDLAAVVTSSDFSRSRVRAANDLNVEIKNGDDIANYIMKKRSTIHEILDSYVPSYK